MKSKQQQLLDSQQELEKKIQELSNIDGIEQLVVIPIWKIETEQQINDPNLLEQLQLTFWGGDRISPVALSILFGKLLRLLQQLHISVCQRVIALRRQIEEIVQKQP